MLGGGFAAASSSVACSAAAGMCRSGSTGSRRTCSFPRRVVALPFRSRAPVCYSAAPAAAAIAAAAATAAASVFPVAVAASAAPAAAPAASSRRQLPQLLISLQAEEGLEGATCACMTAGSTAR